MEYSPNNVSVINGRAVSIQETQYAQPRMPLWPMLNNNTGHDGYVLTSAATLVVDLGDVETVRHIGIRASQIVPSGAPRDLIISSSTDNATWTQHASVAGQTWTNGQRRQYNLATPTAMRSVRLEITNLNGDSVYIAEIDFS
jgi:hypothetical protein